MNGGDRMRKLSVFVLLTFGSGEVLHGQIVNRTCFSSFSTVAYNDSVYSVVGQIASGYESAPTTYLGYLPLQYSLAGLTDIKSSSILIYPNPSNDEVMLKFEDSSIRDIVVLDSRGNIVLSSRVNGASAVIDIEWFAAGIYFLKVESADKFPQTVELIKH